MHKSVLHAIASALMYKCCRGPSVSCDRVENQLRRKTKCGPAPGTAAACPSCGGGRTRQSCRRSERRRRRRAGRLGLYLPTSHESHYFRFVACAVGGVMTTSRTMRAQWHRLRNTPSSSDTLVDGTRAPAGDLRWGSHPFLGLRFFTSKATVTLTPNSNVLKKVKCTLCQH